MLEFDKLPPLLKKLLATWIEPENWGLNLKQACEKAGVNYESARTMIGMVGSLDFYELKARLIDRAMLKLHAEASKALAEKIKKGNTRALELYYRLTKRLADKIELSGALDLNLANEIAEAKRKAQELEK